MPSQTISLQKNLKITHKSSRNSQTIFQLESGDKFSYFENNLVPAYPMQTVFWACDFFLHEKESEPGHAAFLINTWDQNNEAWIQAVIYEYPWYFGQKFFTIPRGPVISSNFNSLPQANQENLRNEFQKLVEVLAFKNNISFLKIEPTFDGDQPLNLKTVTSDGLNDTGIKYDFQKSLKEGFSKYIIKENSKFLQPPYSRTIEIDIDFDYNFEANFNEYFSHYFEKTISTFESKTRYNARLASKKGLTIKWDKSQAAFEEFWNIMQITANKQGFKPYSKKYYKNVLKNSWADLCLVYNQNNQVTNVWMGSFMAGMGMYLYGGSNTEFSSLKGAEFIHTAAIIRTIQSGYKYYDMGGSSLLNGAIPAWDGYSKFKKGFGGKIVEYLPHTYDVVFKKTNYNFINFVVQKVKPMLTKRKSSADIYVQNSTQNLSQK